MLTRKPFAYNDTQDWTDEKAIECVEKLFDALEHNGFGIVNTNSTDQELNIEFYNQTKNYQQYFALQI